MKLLDKINILNNKSKNSIPPISEPELSRFPLKFDSSDTPKVSIIIPFYNQENYTWNCLKHLQKSLSKKYPFEVILIDDNSSELIDFNLIEGIKILKNQVNQGFLKNINIGINKAKGEFIYILNNDTEVSQGFLDELFYVFENFENVGAVGSKLINVDHSLQEAGAVFMKDFKIHQINRNKLVDSPEVNFINKVDYCSGCSLLFKRKSDNNTLNLLDTNFVPAYFEETDFCFQIRHQQSKEIYYTGFSQVYHFDGVSYKKSVSKNTEKEKKKEYLFNTNKEKFYKKWDFIIDSIGASNVNERVQELYNFKSIIFFHNELPRYDVDSGSNRLREIMKTFVKQGYFVTLVVESLRLKAVTKKYIEYFQRNGINVYYKNKRDSNYIKFLNNGLNYNNSIIWFYGPGAFKTYYKKTKKLFKNNKVIYDMIDIHHLRMERTLELNPDDKWCKKNIKKYKRIELSLEDKVDYIVTISDEEKAYMSNYYDSEKLIKLSNIHYLKKGSSSIKPFESREGLLFIGSTHHPNIDAVKWLIDDIMPEVWKVNDTINLHVVGKVYESFKNRDVDSRIVFHGFVENIDEIFESVKMMVAPLRVGAGVKGKLGQALEYSLPIVTTSIGAEGMNLTNYKTALISDKTIEIADSINKLYSNKKLWLKLSDKSNEALSPYSSETIVELIKNNL